MARLTFRRPATDSCAAVRPRVEESAPGLEAPEPGDAAGCGWFDSSFDLWQGLEVREEPVAGAVADMARWVFRGVAGNELQCAA